MAQTTVTLYRPEQTGIGERLPGTEIFGDDSFSISAKAIGVGADGATTYVVEQVISRWPNIADYRTQSTITTTKFREALPYTSTGMPSIQST
jgi:hypothetical protein